MKQYGAENIRNIAIAGHSGEGKTSLAEALLFKAGATDRLGKTADGNAVCDFDPEEIKRKASLSTALAAFEHDGIKINLLDTPGLFDFAGGMYEGVSAAETVIIVISAKSGVKVGTRKAFELARELNRPVMFAVTKIDDPDADYYGVLNGLTENFGQSVAPISLPEIKDGKVASVTDLVNMKTYKYDGKGGASETDLPSALADKADSVEDYKAALSEAIAETDEELMEKFFEGEEFSPEELLTGVKKGISDGTLFPTVCCSTLDLTGITMILRQIKDLLPAASDMKPISAKDAKGEEAVVSCNEKDPAAAFVFKTVADPFVGKMSYIKVIGGEIASNGDYINTKAGSPEKIGKLFSLCGKKQIEAASAKAGDIIVAVKISANTSDTLCAAGRQIVFPEIGFPSPCYNMAITAKTLADENKLGGGIQRLLEEDKTLSYRHDSLTREQVLTGLGEQHLEATVLKLKSKFGAEVTLADPKIAYRETIRKKVKVEGKHKKQTGGHGQYGHVWIEFEPCDSDALVFEEKVFGGSVPRNYFPAVEKGLQEATQKGVLAGYPVTGLKATLLDGSYHPVDSSEMAFKLAASIAYKAGLKQAEPAMLEPIGKLNVTAPDDNTGDIMGDLNKRRGRVLGMNPAKKGMTEIEAEVPMREMQSFTMQLRQITRGMGSFSLDHLRYEQLPGNLVAEVVAGADDAGEA